MQFKKELPGSSAESTLRGEEGEIGDHLGGYCLIQVRGDGGWSQGGARLIELLSVPSGPCNRATFRSATRPACHYPVTISAVISGSSLLPVAHAAFCHRGCHLSFTATVGAAAPDVAMDACFLVPELPRSSQVLDFYCLSCISSAHPLGRRPPPAPCGLNWTLLLFPTWRCITFWSSH